jgi:hypothetical protein
MKLRWIAATMLLAGLGCAHNSQSSHSEAAAPDLDTFRAGLAELDDLERKYLLTSFLRTMQPEDVPAVIAEVEKYRAGFAADDVRLLMLAWTRFDGPGAFETARDWPTGWKTILMEEAMEAWGFNDGSAAQAACEQIKGESRRELLCAEVLDGWVAGHDRAGAAKLVALVPVTKRRVRLAFRLTGNARREGPDAVIALADSVPVDAPHDFKKTIFLHAGGALARLDPGRVPAWYELHKKQRYSAGSLSSIASKWAVDHNPADAIAWVQSLDLQVAREKERTQAIGKAFKIWFAKDPAGAEAWLVAADEGPIRDGALREVAKSLTDESPADALGWAWQIEEEKLKRKMMYRQTRRWFLRDPDAATAWIEAADMSEEYRLGLLNNLPRRSEAETGRRATGEKDKSQSKRQVRGGRGIKKAGSNE